MLETLTNAKELELRRQALVLECELDRIEFSQALEEVDSQTRWYQLVGHAVSVTAPKLTLFMPLVGFFLSKKIFGSGKGGISSPGSWLSKLSLAFSLGRKVIEAVSKFRAQRGSSS